MNFSRTLAPYGYKALIKILLICLFLLGLAYVIPDPQYQTLAIIVIFTAVCFVLYFFRDPDRL